MPRKIIQLERVGMPSDTNFRVAFWLDVPAARQTFYANASATSAVKGATQAEVDAIKAGQVVEVIETLPRPAGTTIGEFRNDAEARYAQLQAELVNRNPFARYGTFWDGSSWTPVTVA